MDNVTQPRYPQLADWRRRTAELYAGLRLARDPQAARERFASTRDELFRYHPQSPLAPNARPGFGGLAYFPYDPDWRIVGRLDFGIEPAETTYELGPDGRLTVRRFAIARFACAGVPAALAVYWAEGYGGGVFLPFGDKTNGRETYGGGRYLYDGIKGADLGISEKEILLDFNFAYNPSCAYDPRWVCPLTPPENRLEFRVPAGEQLFNA